MINKVLWVFVIVMMLENAICFSIKLSFPQMRFKRIINSFKTHEKTSINPINTLMMSLANKIGVGSLSGISLAIYIGGPGTIFWMWLFTILVSINTYLESYLGVKYKEKDGCFYKGGPSYYIKGGLNNAKLSLIYTILIIFSYIFCFLPIQTNTISILIHDTFNINAIVIALVITFLSGIFIVKGLRSISNLCSKIVPFMSFIYICLGIYVLFNNISFLPSIFKLILSDAFDLKSIISGGIFIAIEKVIFATESGLGTGAIASGTMDSFNCEKAGYIQLIGVYFIGLIITSITAIIVLSSNYDVLNLDYVNGIEITKYAFNYHFGVLGDYLLNLILVLFAFSTIITGYYYGESALKSINDGKIRIVLLKALTITLLFIGSFLKPNIIWKLVNVSTGLLALINMYSIYQLKDKISN